MIRVENGQREYYDMNGNRIIEGSTIQFLSGNIEKVYLCEDGQLGIDATNKKWIATGRAFPCEYGIYPLTVEDTNTAVVME